MLLFFNGFDILFYVQGAYAVGKQFAADKSELQVEISEVQIGANSSGWL